jgi:hypothetical protein
VSVSFVENPALFGVHQEDSPVKLMKGWTVDDGVYAALQGRPAPARVCGTSGTEEENRGKKPRFTESFAEGNG